MKTNTRKLLLIPIWATYIFICLVFIRFYLADVYFRKSQDLIKIGSNEKALQYADKAVLLNPLEPNYFRGRAKINAVRLVYFNDTSLIKEFILSDLNKAYKLNPNNLVTIRNSIPIYYFLAIRSVVLESGSDNLDETYGEITSGFFEATKKRFWNDAGVIVSIAKYEKKLNFQSGYEESMERIKQIRPDLLEWNESFR